MPDPRYRVGVGQARTIYQGPGPDDLIGVMDTPELAAMVVEALNAPRSTMFGHSVLECVSMTDPVVDNQNRNVRFALLVVAADG
jgi:hypothetical protein